MANIRGFVRAHDIGLRIEHADHNPNMDDDAWARTANHYHVTLTRAGKRLSTYFSTGSGWTREPDADDVLDSLRVEALSAENARDFEDWASDFGLKWDSDCARISKRAAEDAGLDCTPYYRAKKTYAACVMTKQKLLTFLGPKLLAKLYEVEGL